MIVVNKKKGESKDQLFRKFGRLFMGEEITDEVRERQFYKKPSLQRKEQEKERLKNRGRKRFGRTPTRRSR